MKNVFGGVLMGCGILVGGLSGLCLLIGVLSTLTTMASVPSSDILFGSLIALAGFSVPVAIGVGMFYAGRSLMKSPSSPPPEPSVPPEDIKRAEPPHKPEEGH
jgi:hypothetical protein